MRVSKAKLLVLLAMSAVGIWASGMVLVIFYTLNERLPFCPTGTFFGMNLDCGAVLSSPYSTLFGVPLELLALAYFLVNVGLVFFIAFGSEKASRLTMNVLFGWRFVGILLVPYLVSVELFIIHAICVYCTIMHVAILLDFAVISYLLFFRDQGALPSGGPAWPEQAAGMEAARQDRAADGASPPGSLRGAHPLRRDERVEIVTYWAVGSPAFVRGFV